MRKRISRGIYEFATKKTDAPQNIRGAILSASSSSYITEEESREIWGRIDKKYILNPQQSLGIDKMDLQAYLNTILNDSVNIRTLSYPIITKLIDNHNKLIKYCDGVSLKSVLVPIIWSSVHINTEARATEAFLLFKKRVTDCNDILNLKGLSMYVKDRNKWHREFVIFARRGFFSNYLTKELEDQKSEAFITSYSPYPYKEYPYR